MENKTAEIVIKNIETNNNEIEFQKPKFPQKYPFWARLKICKNRTTLVIDDEMVKDKKNKMVPGFVHREAIHKNTSNRDYEEIKPNPDPDDKDPMYLKRPSKLPQVLFKPHNKNLNMPQHLIDKYGKNNYKNDDENKK